MKYNITLTLLDKFRSLPKGYTIIFDYNETNVIYLMGHNGCGKSTLIQAIRNKINSNADAKRKWGATDVCGLVGSVIDVNIDGFEKIYHLDIDGLDSATSIFNASSATDFVENKGWLTRNMSAGEKSIAQFSFLKNEVIDDEKTLIILDEFDNHLDFEMRIKFTKLMQRLFPKSKKLIVTHDLLMACLNEGKIVEIKSKRNKETNMQCMVSEESPIVWDEEKKYGMFELNTKRKLSEIVK